MEREVFPIMVSTYEALCDCIENNVIVIYVFRAFYRENKERVEQCLGDNGYKMANFRSGWGVFFAKGMILRQKDIPDAYKLL